MSAAAGTQALDRALNEDERKRFARLLRENDYPGARLVAFRFARKLSRDDKAAQDLMGRVDVRLVRSGWDPEKVTLTRALCRFVWSERTHAVEETEAQHKIADELSQEVEAETWSERPRSPEAQLVAGEDRSDAREQLAELRRAFEKTGDGVNLAWLDFSLQEIDDPRDMARLSGRDVREFYRAADRRKTQVRRLLAAKKVVTLQEVE